MGDGQNLTFDWQVCGLSDILRSELGYLAASWPWLFLGEVSKLQTQEFKFLEPHDQLKDGSLKKVGCLPNDERPKKKNVTKYHA